MTLKGSLLRKYRESWEDHHDDNVTPPSLDELERWYKETHVSLEGALLMAFGVVLGMGFIFGIIIWLDSRRRRGENYQIVSTKEEEEEEEEGGENCFEREARFGKGQEK